MSGCLYNLYVSLEAYDVGGTNSKTADRSRPRPGLLFLSLVREGQAQKEGFVFFWAIL